MFLRMKCKYRDEWLSSELSRIIDKASGTTVVPGFVRNMICTAVDETLQDIGDDEFAVQIQEWTDVIDASIKSGAGSLDFIDPAIQNSQDPSLKLGTIFLLKV